MYTKSLIVVVLFAIATFTSCVDAANPGELGGRCTSWLGGVLGGVPLTHCSDKDCGVFRAALFFPTGCDAGLNCCRGNAPASASSATTTTTSTTTASSSSTTTSSSPTTTTTTKKP